MCEQGIARSIAVAASALAASSSTFNTFRHIAQTSSLVNTTSRKPRFASWRTGEDRGDDELNQRNHMWQPTYGPLRCRLQRNFSI
jgi:hypothetical protein